MKYLFELSKEHTTLPKEEIFCLLKTYNIDFKIIFSSNDILIIETEESEKNIKKISRRLSSFTYFVDEFLFQSDIDEKIIEKKSDENKIVNKGSIAVKYKNRSKSVDSKKIVKSLAKIYTKNREVDLVYPDIEIRTVITDEKVFVGQKIYEINKKSFNSRKVQFRPFFSPISLHPKIARCLVNLSEIKKDETLLDPFCGTGGIILEAGLTGIKIIGSDIEEKMINGCKKTLDHYGIFDYNLFCSDIGKIDDKIKQVDSVVCDFPYGKSTTTKGENIEKLVDRSFKKISEVLKKDRKAVVGINDKNMIKIGEKYLDLLKIHEYIVHGSLTRFFVVFQN